MKRKLFSLMCAASMALSVFPSAVAEEESPLLPGANVAVEQETSLQEDATVIVGLYYGSNTLDAVNLQNASGCGNGYQFGYLDDSRTFHSLGYTEEIDISVVKGENVWYGTHDSYVCYFDHITSDILVGSWHVLLPIEVASWEDAFEKTLETGGFPAWIDGNWQLRYGSYATQEEAQTAAETLGGTTVSAGSYGISVVRRGTSQILFQFDGGADLPLIVKPGLDDSIKAVTWMKNSRYFGAFQYSRLNGGDLTVSSVLSLDDYANCVISREMSSSWPLEALKAQAVCARNYYEQKVADHQHRSQGFDICDTTHCQVYFGMGSTNERTAQAAEETSKLRIWYQGSRADIFYFASDGGATEASQNVWVKEYPYLCGVIDPYEATVADKISKYNWTVTYTADELTELLHEKGYGIGAKVIDFQVSERTPNGNVKRITFTLDNGKTHSFAKDSARIFLGLRSIRYSVSRSGATIGGCYYVDQDDCLQSVDGLYAIGGNETLNQVSGAPYVITGSGIEALPAPYGGTPTDELVFTVQGSGNGHNVGMSQWGAYAMALQGFTFEDILKFYFPGVEIY